MFRIEDVSTSSEHAYFRLIANDPLAPTRNWRFTVPVPNHLKITGVYPDVVKKCRPSRNHVVGLALNINPGTSWGASIGNLINAYRT